MKTTKFQLKLSSEYNLVPFLTGNHPQLGNWSSSRALPMSRGPKMSNKTESWCLECSVPSENTEYKYFLGQTITSETKSVQVYFFEPFARALGKERLMLDEFGYYQGKHLIEKRCLENEFEFRLQFIKNPLFFLPNIHTSRIYIKCDLIFPETESEKLINNKTIVAMLDASQDCITQATDGMICLLNRHLALCIRSSVHNPVFRITFYQNSPLEELGYSFICLEPNKCGKMTACITSSNGIFIGTLNFNVLVIGPMPEFLQKSSLVLRKSISSKKTPLFIGHRGFGATFRKGEVSNLLENTLHSFMQAYDKGIRMVEFDVMLSKDKVPVIYHDYKTLLLLTGNGTTKKLELQIQDLSYSDMISNEFQLCKDDSFQKNNSLYGNNSDSKRLFPKLEDVLTELPDDLSFNVEIKYCMELGSGLMEDNVSYTEERNAYLDTILGVIIKFVGSRNLIFSSFDPDICTMLKVKQSEFPVMFLTQGKSHYEEYKDQRTKSIEEAIHFAFSEKLYGIVAYSGPLLENLSIIKHAHDRSLQVYCWGEQNNSLENLKILNENSIDGIILDEIDLAHNF